MFRHIVLFTWIPEATTDQIDAVFDGLHELPGAIPEIRAYTVGRDAGLAEDTFDVAVVGDFDDEAAYRTYATHPAHLALVAERIRPIIARRAAVQHEWHPTG